MNGEGKLETGGTSAAATPKEEKEEEEVVSQRVVYMWGYLPGASPQRSPLMSPVEVKIPPAVESSWKDVSGGGCGFAMATAGDRMFSIEKFFTFRINFIKCYLI